MAASQLEESGFESDSARSATLPGHGKGEHIMAQVVGSRISLPPKWEIRFGFLVPGFDLAQSRLLWVFRKKLQWTADLSLSRCWSLLFT